MKLDRNAIANAAQRLNGHIVGTPVQSLNGEALGLPYRLTLKLENLQHSGSFKARGAMNALLCAEVGSDGVIAASGGNHGVAVAWAARSLRYPANIFVPSLISSRKLEKLKSYGAQVHVTGREYHDALSAARQFTLGRNCVELHAYDQTEVISGAGTIAMEIDDCGLRRWWSRWWVGDVVGNQQAANSGRNRRDANLGQSQSCRRTR